MKRIAALVLAVCPLPAQAAAPTFAADIAPLLRARCAVCHLTGEEAGNLALHPKAAWKSLVGRKSGESPHLIVAPGAPDRSYLIMKLEGTHLSNGGTGDRMPFGAPPLDLPAIAKVRAWIADGAKNN